MSVVLILVWLLAGVTIFGAGAGKTSFECMYQDQNDVGYIFVDHGSVGRSPPEKTVSCSSYCYSIWSFDPDDKLNASRFQLISSGCLDGRKQFSQCDRPRCANTVKALNILNNTSFCCCRGQKCNAYYATSLIDEYFDGDADTDDFYDDYTNYIIFLVFVCILFFTFAVISAKFIRFIYATGRNNTKTMDSLHLLESPCPPLATPNTPSKDAMIMTASENLTFTELIGQGKYGSIWKGKFNDTIVLIKICQHKQNERFWKNESFIYTLPLMASTNLPKFYRNIEQMTENGLLEPCLVIEYGHHGSLQSYLTERTFDWNQMCQLSKSLAHGLAYLHAEVRQDGKSKPSIAHCDLSSANVIVRADGTCMICDFQFAVPFVGIDHESDPIVKERSGTVRYLAPEILDDSQRPCESSLKQADIYALGLILWEIASRCTDLYQGIDVPVFRLPFEREVGLTPSFEQMELLVNRHKARPLFPNVWKNSNYAIRLLKETITECWDHEPEARLTALCIEERFFELPLLWKRHKMESLSNCYMIAMINSDQSKCGVPDEDRSTGKALPDEFDSSGNGSPKNVFYINNFENSLHCKYNDHNHLLHHPQHKHFFPQSPKMKKHLNVNLEKNLNNDVKGCQPRLALPLQPHHARNPCMERNMMIMEENEHDEILEQGLKFSTPARIETFDSDTTEPSENNGEDLDGNFAENRSLIQATPMPIPFVQNYPLSSGDGSNSPLKVKDINRYRNIGNRQRHSFFRHNLLGFLKKRFNGVNDSGESDLGFDVNRLTATLLNESGNKILSLPPSATADMVISSNGDELAATEPPPTAIESTNNKAPINTNNLLNNQQNASTKLAADKNDGHQSIFRMQFLEAP